MAETPAAPRLGFNQRGDGPQCHIQAALRFCCEVDPDLVLSSRVCSTDLPLIAKAVDVLLPVDAVCSASLSFPSKRLHTMAAHSMRPRELETEGPGAPLLSEIADRFYYNVSLPLIKGNQLSYQRTASDVAAGCSGQDYKPF